MDGSNPRILNIPDLTSPKHLTIDSETNTLFWWDEVTKFDITSEKLDDGSFPKVDVCVGLTVYKHNIYWAQL